MDAVREALALLGIEDLILGVHASCFPGGDDDIGVGTPHSSAAYELFRFAHELGFTGIQLGPEGETSDIDPSPYDGAIFARSTRQLALAPLVERGLLPESVLRAVARAPGTRSDHVAAGNAVRRALDEVHARFRDREALDAFCRREQRWLERDALWEVLQLDYRGRDFADAGRFSWDPMDRALFGREGDAALARAREARKQELREQHAATLDRWSMAQLLAHEQHDAMRAHLHQLGLTLLGDLQIGWSRRDLWSFRACFLEGYWMGAPPSRTNPDGQPWGYPVLAPDDECALELFDLRAEKALSEYDGLRIDHPHGLVCPWVYRSDDPDALHAVQTGGRLHESPDLPDHPELARYAYVRPDQLDRTRRRWDDDWTTHLDEPQIARYAARIDRLVAHAKGPIVCEVLSTMPRPLGAVLARHGLGRFRVTQKAKPDDARDVYRSENARPEDWIMVGNHDTDPIQAVAERWVGEGTAAAQARMLAERLMPHDRERAAFAASIANDPRALAAAKLAELFASPARHVYVWWGDLFGEREPYNVPGTVRPENWSLRIAPDFRAEYARRLAARLALDLPRALATALRARSLSPQLAARLVSMG